MTLLFSSSSRASFSALSSSSPLSFASSFSSGSSTLATTNGAPISRFLVKPIDRHAKLFNRVSIPAPTTTNKGAGIIANVSSEIPDAGESQSEKDKASEKEASKEAKDEEEGLLASFKDEEDEQWLTFASSYLADSGSQQLHVSVFEVGQLHTQESAIKLWARFRSPVVLAIKTSITPAF
ncbi:hypothetical protein FH972_019939 [Carpinus fangiana]|uniref:Uncharacterized protein n=1 Tax=Carpinus fangiana TaxID=176857 RepID=A0A5N6RW25_9ROSI|nr:hypothetical protein FH972_019939 [Carpinus fangiana]